MEEVGSCGAGCNERRFCDQSAIMLMDEIMGMKDAGLVCYVEK